MDLEPLEREAVQHGEAPIDEVQIEREELLKRDVFVDEGLEIQARLIGHALQGRAVPVGKRRRVDLVLEEPAQAEPLGGEAAAQRKPALAAQHTLRLELHLLGPLQSAARSGHHLLLVRARAPKKIRELGRQLVRVEFARGGVVRLQLVFESVEERGRT